MRSTLMMVCLLVLLGITTPAEAQLRETAAQSENMTARLYDQGVSSFSLNQLFSPENFRMSHSFEMSTGGFGSLGMYTNTMMWQFSQKVAARVDLAYAYSPDGSLLGGPDQMGQGQGKFLIRNAELAFRPTENTRLHLSVRQSPYGQYMSPYGYQGYGQQPYSRFGQSSSFRASFGSDDRDAFWNDDWR